MPNPSLSSFTSTNQYQSENVLTPLLTGFITGSNYSEPTFNGNANAVSNDIGGLFGWLLYSRATKYSPALGATSDSFIVYTKPTDLIADLNKLGGVTYCLVSNTTQGGTYGFFKNNGGTPSIITGLTAGNEFLYALNYLAYGGTLVISGTPSGLDTYETNSNQTLDVLLGVTANNTICSWLKNKQYMTAVFPTVADSTGQVGAGYTMAPFEAFASVGASNVVSGSTFATKIFNVYGVKTCSAVSTESLVSGSQITYSIPAICDAAGAFTRSKDKNELYLSVAGLSRSKILNGTMTKAVSWSDDTTKNILRTNRVNFYVNYTPYFLGQDLIGATAATSTLISITERIGPARLKIAITNDVTNIGLKYLYQQNNASLRSNVTSEISAYLERYAQYLDTTQTQITCNSTNNQDNSGTLNITISVKPLATIEGITILINLTQ